MLGEDRSLAKGFPTVSPFVGPLTSVNFLVVNEVGAPVEGFTTLAAFMGLQSIMNPLMLS